MYSKDLKEHSADLQGMFTSKDGSRVGARWMDR